MSSAISILTYPHCLIGLELNEARKQMNEWSKVKIEILIEGKEACFMDFNTIYLFCEIDENNIIQRIWKAFDE